MVDIQEQAKIISLISTKWFVGCDLWSVGCGHDILDHLSARATTGTSAESKTQCVLLTWEVRLYLLIFVTLWVSTH